jgi:hypothetical protein
MGLGSSKEKAVRDTGVFTTQEFDILKSLFDSMVPPKQALLPQALFIVS